MANIIDYVRWRGDIPLAQVPLCAVDALVLSYLSYMPFDGMVWDAFDEGISLGDAAIYMAENGLSSSCMIESDQEDCQLLEAIAESERYATMRVTGYVNHFDEAQEKQFAAVTFIPPTGPAFVAFRGTDSSVVGWKEDFNMSFSAEVPAQKAAAAYALRAARALDGEMILGGHSKGGNLAAYAALFAGGGVQSRVQCVYNFDGPGFNETIIASPQFKKLDMRIHTYVPQSSLIGILLWHAESFIVVKSDAGGLFQHNPYTWQVMGGRFITVPERTKESRLAEETIKSWMTSLDNETRERVVDGIYSVLSASDGKNVEELFEGRNIRKILKAVGTMDEETKDIIADAFKRLGNSLKEALPDWFEETAGQIRMLIGGRDAERASEKAAARLAAKFAGKDNEQEENADSQEENG